ncbi:MAG: sigma-E factor negative regulatory protein [Bacteriovorax sp.]|nr:sigma-E factor negative regulatory protein [Rhizobacter sp.]
MSADDELGMAAREHLSALVDGALDDAVVAKACAHWRDDGAARACWHAYQLIGDVLRSDDLASDPAHDTAFMAALSARLAKEPVVLAPQALVSMQDGAAPALGVAGDARVRRRGWLVPSSVAAGFVMVAGALLVARSPDTAPGRSVGVPLASAASAGALAVMAAGGAPSVVESQTMTANGSLIRDARLDRYLAAHNQFAGTSALGVPSGFLRSATVSGPDR